VAIPTNYISTVTYGQAAGVGVNREQLEDWIINLDRTETPLLSSIGDEDVDGIRVEWDTETMRNPKTGATVAQGPMVAGNDEGKAFSAEAMPAINRKLNVCQIFESFWGLTRTQITVARKGGTAGIRNLAGHYSAKVTAELLTAVEARFFSTVSSGGTLTGATRLMKTLDDATATTGMLTDNSALGYGSNIVVNNPAAQATESNFQSILQATWRGGVRVSDIHLAPGWKRKVSMTFVGFASQPAPLVRNTDAGSKMLIAVVDSYQTDFGVARLVNNIWVTGVNEIIGSDDGTARPLSGRIWFLQRDMLKVGWLDRFQSNMMGRVGDGLGFQTVGECTLIVKTDRQGKITGVADPTFP
jgi:hypothetical protein